MAEEGFDNRKETSDPDEDYGLPNIEIKPIQTAESKREKKPVGPPAATAAAGVTKPDAAASQEAEKPSDVEVAEKGSSYTWLVMLLVLALVIAGGWFYYQNANEGESEVASVEPVAEEQVSVPAPPAQEVVEAPVEEEEMFTLTEIKSRGDRTRYFLVVASFIDEDLAKDHAEQLHENKMNTFLVYPYGEIAYYRLAIGQYESFALAAEEIEKVKDNFKENLWVLKY
jgi:hypothetical protein